jgi:hypothetical protein
MAVESIGAIYPTKIPGLADAADIQAAHAVGREAEGAAKPSLMQHNSALCSTA